jgi:hypothetical protein
MKTPTFEEVINTIINYTDSKIDLEDYLRNKPEEYGVYEALVELFNEYQNKDCACECHIIDK